jgi:2-dehydro-3-deoxy-D-gluconate 5-dehydrogenase
MSATSPFDLTDKVALVTGGNGGIGLGIARGLAAAGATIMIAGRNTAKSEAVAAELRQLSIARSPLDQASISGPSAAKVAVFTGDVSSPEVAKAMVAATLEQFGRVDCLVANAGINIRKPPETYSPAEWQSILDTNLNGPFFAAQAVHATMKRQGGGKIITIGSMSSIFGLPFAAAYSATKGGVVQLTKSLATAWAKDNIQVNTILPGWIDTDLTQGARAQVSGLHEKVLARTPAGRWGLPADFGGIAVFLASPASDFITGTAIPVDGGYSIEG